MKTHFIFNFTTLIDSDIISLIRILLENKFPVTVVSVEQPAIEIEKHLIACGKVVVRGSEQGQDLRKLYMESASAIQELQYLTVVFAKNSFEQQAAEALGFYVILLAHQDLKKNFKKLKIAFPYQLQYLPEIKKIENVHKYKMGYPASLFQWLRGKYTKEGVKLNRNEKKISGEYLLDFGNFNFFINNPGDPFYPSENYQGNSCIFEQEIIKILAHYYGLPTEQARGFVTSGGTEGNFSGLWWARNHLRSEKVAVYYSSASHYSIYKIARQLKLQSFIIPAKATEEIDLDLFAKAIILHMKKHPQTPIIVNANAGTIKTGAVDDLPAMKKILEIEVVAKGGKYSLHLDAACLGAVLPLVKPYGEQIRNYFAELSIDTIAISTHKFFGTNSVSGVILTRKEFLESSRYSQEDEIAYVGRIHDITPSGSRSGNHALQIHNIFYMLDLHTDCSRLKKLLEQTQKNCAYLYQQLSAIQGPEKIIWLKNSFSIVFPKPSLGLIQKYSLMPVSTDSVGIYGLFNLTKNLMDEFIEEYRRERG